MAKKSDAQKAAEKAVKKSHPATLILAILFLIVGAVAGVVLSRELTKNDKFELIGEKQVELAIGASYKEAGVKIISFGRDISDKVAYGGDFATMGEIPEEGIYQIVYTVDDFRWGDYQLVRTVIVGKPEGAEGLNNG